MATESAPENSGAPWRERWKKRGALIGVASAGFGTWCLAIVLCVIFPCLPVAIDVIRTKHVTASGILVTAAVLSSTYGCSAEHNFYRALYTLTFIVSIIFCAFGGDDFPISFAGSLLGSVCVLHATERFWWHVVWDRPFPDFLWRTAK